MSAQFYFTMSYLPFLSLQGMALAVGGRIGRLFERVSYAFAVASVCSYIIFLDKII